MYKIHTRFFDMYREKRFSIHINSDMFTFEGDLYMKDLPFNIPIELVETRAVLKKLASTRSALAELKGVAGSIPNENILIDTLVLQEAKDSSEIESIITTHDEIYSEFSENDSFASPAAKEVRKYADALKLSFSHVRDNGFIHNNLIFKIQEKIEGNNAGFRKQAGTKLINDQTGEVVYTPPQNYQQILELMANLEDYINKDESGLDPLIKMAIIHHQFESIHPFYDGNGRTGRILNILYLIQEQLLNLPILYISKYINKHRQQYYQLLQQTRANENWEPWLLYMLEAVEQTSLKTIEIVKSIKVQMLQTKNVIRQNEPKIYSQDLINTIFRHPYSKINQLEKDLQISRITATRYLEVLVKLNVLNKIKKGRTNFYINHALFDLLKKV